jgi:hypothetical protein
MNPSNKTNLKCSQVLICYFKFPLTQLLREWIQFLFRSNWSPLRPEAALKGELRICERLRFFYHKKIREGLEKTFPSRCGLVVPNNVSHPGNEIKG